MQLVLDGQVPASILPVLGQPKLFRLHDSTIEAVRALDLAEVTVYETARDHLAAVRQGDILLIMAEQNWDEFRAALAEVVLPTRLVCDDLAEEKAAHDVNRRLASYLASMRLYLDYEEKRIKRRYGKASTEASAFSAVCSSTYDRSFAYRFASRLRNFSLHHGQPIGKIITTDSVEDSTGKPRREATVLFDIAELLQERTSVWKSLAAELEERAPFLDVATTVASLAEEVRAIRDSTRSNELPQITQDASDVLSTYGEAMGAPGQPTVGRYIDAAGHLAVDFDGSLIPMMRLIGISRVPYEPPRKRS